MADIEAQNSPIPMSMSKYQAFFVSHPSIGNLVPVVEFARHLIHRDPRFSATVFIITVKQRALVNDYIQSLSTSTGHRNRLNFIFLPTVDPPTPDQYQSSLAFLSLLVDKYKPHVKNAISNSISNVSGSDPIAHVLFVDMFTTSMIDVAKQLCLPCYLFFASPASFLGFMLHLRVLHTQLGTDFVDTESGLIVPKDSATELIIPSFANPLPPSILPSSVLKRNKDGYSCYLYNTRRYKETKGIIVNSFVEMEPHAIDSLSASASASEIPPVYPVGPIIDLAGATQYGAHQDSIMKWLDDQPPSSVVFLCFGSMGSFDGPQLREIATGLERSGYRFLWSVREPAAGKLDLPGEYGSRGKLEAVLPVGFLDRTAGLGHVCGWVPQVCVLAHQAIGGFVSHCGWNSILESVWYGVPIATWPVYAEQQMNAFEFVKELGLGVEIRLDYRGMECKDLVSAEELERGLRRLMDGVGEDDDKVKSNVKKMKRKSREALMENGSSYESLGYLIQEITSQNPSSSSNS